MGAGPRGELREERRGPQATGFRPAGREGQVRWVRRPEQHVGFIFVLAFFFFFGPAPWVTEKSYYRLILSAGIQLFTYS